MATVASYILFANGGCKKGERVTQWLGVSMLRSNPYVCVGIYDMVMCVVCA